MNESLFRALRCPFCGTALTLIENEALVRTGDEIESGVAGCECCAFPIVAGIPVLLADDPTRDAMHALEAGDDARALELLLGLDEERTAAFRALRSSTTATYRDTIAVLSPDAEGTYFVYRPSDPTFVMAEAVLDSIGQNPHTRAGRVLDLCGGSGHLTRVLQRLQPHGGVVLADVYFWKLWLATRFTAPSCAPVCCDANNPLPFDHDTFSMVVLSDAFPYIWHKRLLAGEMMRVAGPEGTIVMPHLHSALGENFSAGMTLTPGAYRDLFAPRHPRLFPDSALLTQALETAAVDLSHDTPAEDLAGEPSLTLVASADPAVFRTYQASPSSVRDAAVPGEWRVNPLYQIERAGTGSVLTLAFPTPEYAEEFQACLRYLPERIALPFDATAPLTPGVLGADRDTLLRRRIILDVPLRYC